MTTYRPIDDLRVTLVGETTGGFFAPINRGQSSEFTGFTSFLATLDMTAPSEVSFELGDDDTYKSINDLIAPGKKYEVTLNGRPVLKGRVEANDAPTDAQSGSVARFTVRTKLADAMFASADAGVSVRNTTLEKFILSLYRPQGFTKSDFDFRASLARDLLTGKGTVDGKPALRLATIKIEEARVHPPETIYAAADRHLRRFGLLQWDSPDGKIVIGYPEQDQTARYHLQCLRGERGLTNNVVSITPAQDYSQVPSTVVVHGVTKKKNTTWAISSYATDSDAVAAGLSRPVTIVAEGVLNQQAARNAAARELSARIKSKDTINVEMEGLSFWDDFDIINWGVDTMAQIETNVRSDTYYVHRVELSRDATKGDVTRLVATRKGLWKLFPEVYQGVLTGQTVNNFDAFGQPVQNGPDFLKFRVGRRLRP